jgi:hypothetical protein
MRAAGVDNSVEVECYRRRGEVLVPTELPTGAIGDKLAGGPSLLRFSKRNTSATATRYMRGATLQAGRISAAMNL